MSNCLTTVQNNTILKPSEYLLHKCYRLTTVQNNTILKLCSTQPCEHTGLTTVQNNTILKPQNLSIFTHHTQKFRTAKVLSKNILAF